MARKLVVGLALLAAVIAALIDFGDDSTPTVLPDPRPPEVVHVEASYPTLAAPIEPGDLRLEGIVVDRDEHPVGGATVRLAGAREAVTEADGAFAFDGLAAGSYALVAEKQAAYAEVRDTKLTATSEPVTLTLRRGARLIVHVVAAESGAPIANAKVETSDRAGVTDATGTVALRALDIGSTRIEVAAEGRVPATQYVGSDDPELDVERSIELSVGASLSGIVLDENGAPLPDASVNIDTISGNWHEWVRTGSDGKWTVAAVAGGKQSISALATHHISAGEIVVETDGMHPRSDVVVRVDRGSTISGVVKDARGTPVANAEVSTGFGGATTDASGAYSVSGIPAGDYSVSAETKTAGSPEVKVTLGHGEHATVDITLSDGSIAGRVVDAGGAVADARLRARNTRNDHLYAAYTDDSGRFDFGGMEPGEYLITVNPHNLELGEALSRVVATGKRDVRIVLPQPITLAGRVLLDGKPLQSYGVVVSSDPDPRYTEPTPVRVAGGRFARTDIGPGTWAVTIVGRDIAKKTITGVQLDAGRLDLGDISVERGRVITGRVVDETGRGIADARVEASGDSFGDDEVLERLLRGEVFTRTAADGSFRLAGAPAGELELRASHPTLGVAIPGKLGPSDSSAQLVVVATGVLDGTIEEFSDLVTEAVITDLAGNVILKTDLDRGGAFHFARVPVGVHIVALRGADEVQAQRIEIRAGRPSRVYFRLRRQPITVKLDHKDCTRIALRDLQGTTIATTRCQAGRGELSNVSPGRYLACADSGACKPIEVNTWVTIQIYDI